MIKDINFPHEILHPSCDEKYKLGGLYMAKKLKSNKKSNITASLKFLDNKYIWLIFTVFISIIFMIIILRLWEVDLSVQIHDGGDAVGVILMSHEAITGKPSDYFLNAPFTLEDSRTLYPSSGFIFSAIFKFFSLFTSEPGVVSNLSYFLGYPLIAVCCYIFFIQTGISPFIAAACSVLYTFIPFHYNSGITAILLASYFIAPLICIAAFWLINDKLGLFDASEKNIWQPDKKKYIIIFCLLCFLMGLSEIYGMAFGILVIFIAGIYSFTASKSWKTLAVACTGISLTFLAAILQNIKIVIAYLSGSGLIEDVTLTRNYTDIQRYALSITQLVLPISTHRSEFFEKIKSVFINRGVMGKGADFYALGMVGSIGLVICIFVLLFYNKKSEKSDEIKKYGMLTIVLILVCTVDGLNLFIGLVSYAIRTYRRIIIFIALFSLGTVAVVLQSVWDRLSKKKLKAVFAAGVAGLMLFGIWDQTPGIPTGESAGYQNTIERQTSLRDFVGEIEKSVPAGSFIFQLPVTPRGGEVHLNNMGIYAMGWPSAYSDSLHWSYIMSRNINSVQAKWQTYLGTLPMDERIDNLCYVDFAGIYIDSFAYTPEEFEELSAFLIAKTEAQPIVSGNNRWYFLNIESYKNKLRRSVSESDWINLREQSLDKGYNDDIHYYDDTFSLMGYNGEYTREKDHILLHPGTLQFGPYCSLKQGTYKITVHGDNLGNSELSCYADKGGIRYSIYDVNIENDMISYIIILEESRDDIEFTMRNTGNSDMVFYGISSQRITSPLSPEADLAA